MGTVVRVTTASGVFNLPAKHTTHIYMAKFLAELLGCTLPEKGASPMFEVRLKSVCFHVTCVSVRPNVLFSEIFKGLMLQ